MSIEEQSMPHILWYSSQYDDDDVGGGSVLINHRPDLEHQDKLCTINEINTTHMNESFIWQDRCVNGKSPGGICGIRARDIALRRGHRSEPNTSQ